MKELVEAFGEWVKALVRFEIDEYEAQLGDPVWSPSQTSVIDAWDNVLKVANEFDKRLNYGKDED